VSNFPNALDGPATLYSPSVIAPDGNQTADVITAVTDTPVIQQQIAGLADGGTYTSGVPASSKAMTRRKPTRAPGPRKRHT